MRRDRELFCTAPGKQIGAPEDREKIISGETGCAIRGCARVVGSRTGIQTKAYDNQFPAAAFEACKKAGKYQAGSIILILGLYVGKAPVFRFFKTEESGGDFRRLKGFQTFCLMMRAQGVLIKPVWIRPGSVRICIRHIPGLKSRTLKQNPTDSYIHDCEGVMFCEG